MLKKTLLGMLVLILVVLPIFVYSANLDFSWLPNEDDADNYRIYYGATSRNYSEVIEVGFPDPVDGRIHGTVENVPEGETWFFAATATMGVVGETSFLESDYSTEIEHYVPVDVPLIMEPPQDFTVDQNTTTFSWVPNTQEELINYEIYCDTTPAAQIPAEEVHDLLATVLPTSIEDGRVTYVWNNFPVGTYYCVVVAVGSDSIDNISSDFSSEITFSNGIPLPPVNFRLGI